MHPDYATSLNDIATAYKRKENYDKALQYYFKSIEIRKFVLG